MQFSAGQIAELLHGEVDGDAQVLVSDVSRIEEGRLGTLTFLANPKYTDFIYTTGASVAIVGRDFRPARAIPRYLTLIRVQDPRAAFALLLDMHQKHQYEKVGYEQPSYISPKATIGKGVYIGAFSYVSDNVVIEDGAKIFPNCFIGDGVRIGKGTRMHAGTKVYHRCIIGADCLIHSGVVIGADGFGFNQNAAGVQEKMAQVGNVVIEDAVEIGANTTVDRATMGSTIIRRGAKLDNLIQVGHNVEIGEDTIVVAQTGIAGSSKIGARCVIAGQVGIAGHLTIGDEVKIAAQSGVANNIPDGTRVQGAPAFAIGEFKRSYVHFRNLPEIKQRISALEKELASLKELQDKP